MAFISTFYSPRCRILFPHFQKLQSQLQLQPQQLQFQLPYTNNVRWISTTAAKKVLGFGPSDRPTMKELRAAYFDAAKKTHPDAVSSTLNATTTTTTSTTTTSSSSGDDFCRVTEAYERLLDSKEIEADWTWKISREEENEYRHACMAVLGIPAEIVEESKQNPMFRHWLGGNTDGAQHWRAFFSVHGGLAQKLQQPIAFLASGQEVAAFETRRRRKR